MNYELAKALKDAGFPEPSRSEYYAGEFKCGCNEDSDVQGQERKEVLSCGRQYIYYPTLSELIKACGDSFNYLSYLREEGEVNEEGELMEWAATGLYGHTYFGKTPEEAVAKLWLELNK